MKSRKCEIHSKKKTSERFICEFMLFANKSVGNIVFSEFNNSVK